MYTATIATKDATTMADTAQANTFVVEAECSHTHVDAAAGGAAEARCGCCAPPEGAIATTQAIARTSALSLTAGIRKVY